jgi:hypothetical protein
MPRRPPRSDTNATCYPSGEIAGRSSMASLDVNGRASVPSGFDVHRLRFAGHVELTTIRTWTLEACAVS